MSTGETRPGREMRPEAEKKLLQRVRGEDVHKPLTSSLEESDHGGAELEVKKQGDSAASKEFSESTITLDQLLKAHV